MMTTPVWHGTSHEAELLRNAIARNCACEMDPESGVRSLTCGPHQMLLTDQRALDGMLFERRRVECLMREEGLEQ